MREDMLKRIVNAIEAVKASHDGCGRVVIEIVKGKVTHIRNSVIEAVKEDGKE